MAEPTSEATQEAPAVTRLLQAWKSGDREVVDRLIPLIYDELRAIAHRQLRREPSGHTLSTTALVHEAYPKLIRQTRADWRDRAHFYAIAARVMRRILVDKARKKYSLKRGGRSERPVSLDEMPTVAADGPAATILAVDRALERLAALNERQNRVVECRFFGGLTEAETAAALDVSERTVRRDWTLARAWLQRELEPSS